jgi:hypothetical protein
MAFMLAIFQKFKVPHAKESSSIASLGKKNQGVDKKKPEDATEFIDAGLTTPCVMSMVLAKAMAGIKGNQLN